MQSGFSHAGTETCLINQIWQLLCLSHRIGRWGIPVTFDLVYVTTPDHFLTYSQLLPCMTVRGTLVHMVFAFYSL